MEILIVLFIEKIQKLVIRVSSYFSRSKELFIIIIIPYYLKKFGADSFFPRALNIANNISSSLDSLEFFFFHLLMIDLNTMLCYF
jgi:hypothetical protein